MRPHLLALVVMAAACAGAPDPLAVNHGPEEAPPVAYAIADAGPECPEAKRFTQFGTSDGNEMATCDYPPSATMLLAAARPAPVDVVGVRLVFIQDQGVGPWRLLRWFLFAE